MTTPFGDLTGTLTYVSADTLVTMIPTRRPTTGLR